MQGSRYTEHRMALAPKQVEPGDPAPKACRKLGISDAMYHDASKKCGGLTLTRANAATPLQRPTLESRSSVPVNRIQAPGPPDLQSGTGQGRHAGPYSGELPDNVNNSVRSPPYRRTTDHLKQHRTSVAADKKTIYRNSPKCSARQARFCRNPPLAHPLSTGDDFGVLSDVDDPLPQ